MLFLQVIFHDRPTLTIHVILLGEGKDLTCYFILVF